jgi:hypothetical protein
MNMGQLVEWKLAGEAQVFGVNLPHSHFVCHKSDRRGGKLAPSRLGYGTAILIFTNSRNEVNDMNPS